MSYDATIEGALAELARVRDANYEANGYQPVERAYQSREGRGEEGYNVKQLQTAMKKKRERAVEEIDITQADIFNRAGQGEEVKPPWAKLEVTRRVQIMEDFLSTHDPNYGEEVNGELVKMVSEGLLKRKSDLTYDANNERIVEIHVVAYNADEARFYVNIDSKKRNEARRKRIKKLLS